MIENIKALRQFVSFCKRQSVEITHAVLSLILFVIFPAMVMQKSFFYKLNKRKIFLSYKQNS